MAAVITRASERERDARAGIGTGVEARAVAALLTCIGRTGWTKTTFDDVAREAGCSRATLYRYFTGKGALLAVAVTSERERFRRELGVATTDAATLEDALVAVLTTATRLLRDHDAFQFMLAFEPDVVLPWLTFSAGDRVLVRSGEVIAPAVAPFLDVEAVGGRDPAQVGEWLARTTFVYLQAPDAPFDLAVEADARDLVREFLSPALTRSSIPSKGE